MAYLTVFKNLQTIMCIILTNRKTLGTIKNKVSQDTLFYQLVLEKGSETEPISNMYYYVPETNEIKPHKFFLKYDFYKITKNVLSFSQSLSIDSLFLNILNTTFIEVSSKLRDKLSIIIFLILALISAQKTKICHFIIIGKQVCLY